MTGAYVSDPIGTILNDTYRLEGLLGQGGMGQIYEAAHLRLDRRFAVKLLIPEVADDEVALGRFHQEARITSGLGHPHIVEVIDFNSTTDGQPYIVMEQLEGESLDARIQRVGRLDLPTVASIVRQVTSALHAAHKKGVVHRDLKPQNIFLCQRGSRDDYVKLLDFGISKVLGSSSVMTRTHALVGSPGYMSPEQADEENEEVDARCDVYGMGTLIFEMFTGAPPFTATSIPSLLYKIVHQEPPDLCELRPELPDDMGRVVVIALSKRPEERYGSIEELWGAFSEVLESAKVAYIDRTRIQHTAWPVLAPLAGQEEALDPTEETLVYRSPEPENPIITDALLPAQSVEQPPAAIAPAAHMRSSVGLSTTLSVSAGELHPRARRIGPLVAAAVAVVAGMVAGSVIYLFLVRSLNTPPAATDAGTISRDAASAAVPRTKLDATAHAAADAASSPPPDVAMTIVASMPPATSPSLKQQPLRPAKRPGQSRGTLIVGTLPYKGRQTWGNVYLNGVKKGGTPLSLRVRSGVHTVEVRQGQVTKRRKVRVRAGRAQRIMFRLQ